MGGRQSKEIIRIPRRFESIGVHACEGDVTLVRALLSTVVSGEKIPSNLRPAMLKV